MRNSQLLNSPYRSVRRLKIAPPPPRAESDSLLLTLRAKLRHELSRANLGELPAHLITRALRDAESAAAMTPYPHLFLPALAEEKIQSTKVWYQRQRHILERTSLALAE